ncbi:hypothetical protein EC912_101789 [Luteibacter rhizovicinus]|uniref:Uncharacterized protein n=1 Tax=Luteibacter rhizovicinus TaxID=242606 RepID=A0A4R3YYY9_9GAMM|nr:hypothetical protein [Luteibacter rhizovicinus]TCV97772.1 hypothetical protein EC912_101789 [Luteibacter rhizovicinus]
MAALGGAAVGTAGGIAGALVGIGIPEFEAKRYDAKVREGDVLISVHNEDGKQRELAKEIFERHNADGIATGSEARAVGPIPAGVREKAAHRGLFSRRQGGPLFAAFLEHSRPQ